MVAATKQDVKSVDELRKWLQPTEYLSPGNEYTKHLNSYVPGTGDWLRDSEAFRKWEDGTQTGCLWVRGLPGSGKSVFAASTVKTLAETQDSEGRKSPVLFFFFRQIVERNHDPIYLVRDWIAQLLPFSPDLQEKIDAISCEVGGRDITRLWDAFTGAMGKLTKVYCVVDALDEMDDQHASFIENLKELGAQRPDRIKVMLTSRPIPSIENLLRHPTIESVKLEPAQIYPDIVSFVSTRLKRVNPRLGEEKEGQVSKAICDRSGGLFLYARLMMDSLNQGLEEGSIVEETLPASLAQLPQNLTELYTRLLEEHSNRSNVTLEQQFTILQCVILSSRPMRLIELGSVMALLMNDTKMGLKEGKETVRQACGRLLEILEDESVSVIHHSFTEFVRAQWGRADSSSLPVPNDKEAQCLMLQTCLQYLSSCLLPISMQPSTDIRGLPEEPEIEVAIGDGSDGSDNNDYDDDDYDYDADLARADKKKEEEIQYLRSTYPFVTYATDNLLYHAKAADGADAELSLLDTYFGPGKNALKIWLLMKWTHDHHKDMQPLHVAAHNGLTAYSRHLISTGSAVDAKDDGGRTPLLYAAEKGHVEIASLLLSHGANPDADDNIGYKPLHVAAMEDQPEIVRLLLAAGVSPKTPKTRCSPALELEQVGTDVGHTPLLYACRMGRTEILNQFIAYLDTDDACRCLHWATRRGNADAVEAILKSGKAPVNVLIDGVSALIRAAKSMDSALFEVMLKHGAKPNLRAEKETWYGDGGLDGVIKLTSDSKRGPTAMHVLAGFRGQEWFRVNREEASKCIQLLIDAGGEVNKSAAGGHTHHFTTRSRNDTHPMHGADPNKFCNNGATPLHDINPNRPKLVEMLVRNGADVNARDKALCTPLLTILASPVIVERRSSNSKSVEMKEKTLLTLLEHGADVTAEGARGWTVFHLMFKNIGQFQTPMLWKAFINAGADLNKPDKNGDPPSKSLKAGRGRPENEELLRVLVIEGLQLNSTQLSDNKLLFDLFRTHGVQIESFQELFNIGCSAKARDSSGATLLHSCIAFHEPLDIFEFLVNSGADALAVDNHGNNLFHEIILANRSRGFDKMVQTLIKLGVSTSKNSHPRIFEEILKKKDYNLFIELVKAGGDLYVSKEWRQPPALHLLVTGGRLALLEMYLEAAAKMDFVTWDTEEVDPGSLLCNACEQALPRLDVIKVLVEKVKVDVNHISNRHGFLYKGSKATALHWLSAGAHFWNIEAIGYLLDHGADIEARNAQGRTPLMTAIDSDHPNGFWKEQTMRLLLERGANPNALSDNGSSCLIKTSSANVTRMLLDFGADITFGRPPLRSALMTMNVDAARMLLEAGADPDKDHLLHTATRPNEFDIDDLDDPDDISFWIQRQREMISLLLEYKANPFNFMEDGFSILQMIIEEHGILDLFWNLPNFPIELRGKGGRTPLISACFPSATPGPTEWTYKKKKPKPKLVCDPDAASQLLKMRADVMATDDLGRTALHWLCTLQKELDEPQQALFTALVGCAPTVIHQKDKNNWTPLQIAIANSYTHDWIVNFLIVHGCDPAERDPTGSTVLHYLAPQLLGEKAKALAAAERFKYFLSRGLSIHHRNVRGETSLFRFISTSWIATDGGPETSNPSWAIENDISHLIALPLFLDAEAGLHTRNDNGETLLHATASRLRKQSAWRRGSDQHQDMLGIFKDLMARGVDPRAEDLQCRTAIDIAVACENRFLVELFGPKERAMVKVVVVEDTEGEDEDEEEDESHY